MFTLRLAAALVLLATLTASSAVSAQEGTPEARLALVRQPAWHEPGDELDLRIRVINSGADILTGYRLVISAHSRMLNRSALHSSFEEILGVQTSSFSKPVAGGFEDPIAPGSDLTIDIAEPLTELPSLAASTEGGVYPVTIALLDANSQLLDSLTTPLVFYPSAPDPPLQLALVLPINEVPQRDPDGIYRPDASGTFALAEALTVDGWLTGWLDALEGLQGSVAVALTPRLAEEVADLADGFIREVDDEQVQVARAAPGAEAAASAIDRLSSLFDRPTVESVFVPYAFPDAVRLPADAREPNQLDEAEVVMKEIFDRAPPRTWFFPPAGRLDRAALDGLRRGGPGQALHTFVSDRSLVPPADPSAAGCPQAFASFTCPITIDTIAGPTDGLVSDPDVQTRFADLSKPGQTRLDLQKLLAETAMIREELPGVPGRVLHAVVPSLWHPTPSQSGSLLRALDDAPWLELITPQEALDGDLEPVERTLVETATPVAGAPEAAYDVRIGVARRVVGGFGQIRPPESLIERLERNLLVAESRTFWRDPNLLARGDRFAEESRAEAEAELKKFRIGGSEQVTLTSRQGTVQLLVFNDADYPATINLRLESNKLSFAEAAGPREFQPETTPIAIEVTAEASGIFPMEASLESPDGYPLGASRTIRVRSTEFNEIALLITGGALGFLIIFYVLRALRRRERRTA